MGALWVGDVALIKTNKMNTNEKIFKAFNTINAEVKENIFKPKLAINNSDRKLFWTNWNQKLVNRILDIKSK